jgi:hypothetical protein
VPRRPSTASARPFAPGWRNWWTARDRGHRRIGQTVLGRRMREAIRVRDACVTPGLPVRLLRNVPIVVSVGGSLRRYAADGLTVRGIVGGMRPPHAGPSSTTHRPPGGLSVINLTPQVHLLGAFQLVLNHRQVPVTIGSQRLIAFLTLHDRLLPRIYMKTTAESVGEGES